MIENNLRTIGLTDSETKVYLALLRLGLTSKGKILKEAKIAPSKVYHVLDKLMDKGLVSMIIKNNVKHFAAAPISRIKDYLDKKKDELAEEEKTLAEVQPQLEALQKRSLEKTTAEIFFGWKGMETAYYSIIDKMKKGQEAYILGASKGADPERSKTFFAKYNKKALAKGIRVKVIFNENARQYALEGEKEIGMRYSKRFLPITTPVEVAVTQGITALVMLKEEPLIILIHDKETSESFMSYFKQLWKIAKP